MDKNEEHYFEDTPPARAADFSYIVIFATVDFLGLRAYSGSSYAAYENLLISNSCTLLLRWL